MVNRFLFETIAAGIVVLALLSCDSLGGLYMFCARGLSIDLAWVKEHTLEISNFGHIIFCFIMTYIGSSVFRNNYLKAISCVALLAGASELLQNFSPTRQAKVGGNGFETLSLDFVDEACSVDWAVGF